MRDTENYSKYIGIPYKPHGRGTDGLDCYGLALLIFREEGIWLPDPWYEKTDISTNHEVLTSLKQVIPYESLVKPEKNCIIEFSVEQIPSHIGIYIGHGEFIHALQKYGVVVTKLQRWEQWVLGFYKVLKGQK